MDQNAAELVRVLTGFGSDEMGQVGIWGFVFIMAVSLASAFFISYLYKFFYSPRSTGSQIHRAFPLLGLSVTSIFITIQFSLPLSLGLLGALSIVRFRTPIKEPEEIGFLMLVIAASISCATFNLIFLGILLSLTVLGLFILRLGVLDGAESHSMVIATIQGDREGVKTSALINYLGRSTKNGRVESISNTDDEATISYAFIGLDSTLAELQAGLRELLGSSRYDIFLNQQRVI